MEKKEIKSHIDAIIAQTFETLKLVYDYQQENKQGVKQIREYYNQKTAGSLSRLVFPKYSKKYYRDGETRLSEQELRFLFVEKFNQYCTLYNLPWYYSVETPTEEKYQFSDHGNKVEAHTNANGQSAMVDFAIHEEKEFKRIALIEFKALNPDASCFEKDFVKLDGEPVELTYFIMYVKSHDKGTIKSLKLKIEKKSSNTEFRCYDLESGQQIEQEILEK